MCEKSGLNLLSLQIGRFTGADPIELRPFLEVLVDEEDRGLLAVHPSWVYGLALLSHEGCRVVYTISRNTSVPFFAKLGFVPVPEQVPDHPVFLEHGIRFHKMAFHCLAERPEEEAGDADQL